MSNLTNMSLERMIFDFLIPNRFQNPSNASESHDEHIEMIVKSYSIQIRGWITTPRQASSSARTETCGFLFIIEIDLIKWPNINQNDFLMVAQRMRA